MQQYFFGCKRDETRDYNQNDPLLSLPINQNRFKTINNVDLRAMCPPIYDQGQLNSCVANAAAFCIQYDQIKYQMSHQFTPSRLFIYYNIRVLEGTVPYDNGAYIRDALVTVGQKGACPETLWPYNINQFASKPSSVAYVSGYAHLTTYYARLTLDLNQMKQCLITGYPFIFGMIVYESFGNVGSNGLVPIPTQGESILGGHAMVCVGFDDITQRFTICNSWGTNWGDHGVCYIPYTYMCNSTYVWDLWTFREINDLEFNTNTIISASYGKNTKFINVTSIVKNHFNSNTQLLVSNQSFTDPYYGIVKELRLSINNSISLIVPENKFLYQSDLNYVNISSVLYGKKNRYKDVTNIFKNQFNNGSHSIQVENNLFTDSYPRVFKELRITFTDNNLLIFPEHSTVSLSQITSNYNIVKISYIENVLYGSGRVFKDVTTIVKNQFAKGYPLMRVTNTLLTDPCYGIVKELKLTLSNGTILTYPEWSYVYLATLSI